MSTLKIWARLNAWLFLQLLYFPFCMLLWLVLWVVTFVTALIKPSMCYSTERDWLAAIRLLGVSPRRKKPKPEPPQAEPGITSKVVYG